MSYNKLNISGAKADILSWVGHELSEDELQMVRNVSLLPCVYKHIALMPDAHLGIGSMIGSVIATRDAVIPAAVGVDIGCGMMAVKTPFGGEILEGKLKELRHQIERTIPVGFNWHKEAVEEAFDWEGWKEFEDLHPGVQKLRHKALNQLGTLGSGNHFVEVCLDAENAVWLMLHSGSRGIGNRLAMEHIASAKTLHAKGTLPDPNLAFFTFDTMEFERYWHDVGWAQRYAEINREIMMTRMIYQFDRMFTSEKEFEPELVVNCHHNYVARETHFGEEVFVTRKGAINAEKERLGIIPGSMGAKSYVVKGLGNPQSYNSCAHGAGRRMSRTEAKKTFSISDMESQTVGVECRKDRGVVDEIPAAYKDIDTVMENQSDLVEVVAELKQVVCVKG